MLLYVGVVGAFFEELGGRGGRIDDGRIVDSWLGVCVGLERADALPALLIVHSPHA